jgi:CPA1 family monovalent cation:H+ antiporter
VIFSLAGARGTVTLASVMSIPLTLADGSLFPERDLIISEVHQINIQIR